MNREYQYTFNISGIVVCLHLQHEILVEDRFKLFMSDEKPDYNIYFQKVETLDNTDGEVFYEGISYAAFSNNDSEFKRKFWDRKRNKYLYSTGTYDWKNRVIIVKYLQGEEEMFGCVNACFFYIAWEEILMHERRIMLHSSFVETAYGSILFSGVSGAGKSTQADLWYKYRNSRMLNGDRTILQWSNEELIGYGSPYAGSSKCYIDDSSRISAIVFPEKKNFCKVRKLDRGTAFRRIFSGLTVNSWNVEFVEFACSMAEKIVKLIPCYELSCTPDKNAVEVLEKVLREEVVYE